MYAQDFDEVNVPERLWLPEPGKKISFRALLQPYVKNKRVFVCPGAPELSTFATVDWERLGFDDGSGLLALGVLDGRLTSGYGMARVHWKGGHPSTGDNYGVPTPMIAVPSECILLADSINGFGPRWDGWYSVFWAPNEPGYVRGVTQVDFQLPQTKQDTGGHRHNGGATYIFVDGHAKWYRADQIPCTADKCFWAIEHHH
jgi:prepilin-type processing-associated H-X9-DG protein